MDLRNKKKKLSIHVILNPCKASGDEIYSLAIRVLYCRKKKEYSLGRQVHRSNYRVDGERVVYSPEGILKRRDPGSINRLIMEEKEGIVKSFLFLERTEPGFGLERLMQRHHKERHDQYVEKFILQYIDSLREEGKLGTADAYMSGLRSLLRFCSPRKIKFKDVDYVFITDYMHYLRARGVAENTVHMYLSNFRAICNKARKQGVKVGKDNPFADLDIRRRETVKRALSKEEIALIASANLRRHPRLEQARDLFMFSFYCRGMSFVDVIHLRNDWVVKDTIFYARSKTGQRLQVGLLPDLQKIIEKYRTDSPYIFPYIDSGSSRSVYTQYRYALGMINRYLKQLGRLLHIDLPLTTYVARHSWATIAKNEGIPISLISEGLGHTSEKTTQIYLASFPVDAVNRVNESVAAAVGNCIKKGGGISSV